MASTRQLKTRIRSVSSTKQITKAMQMVAASKMRRAQEATKASAPYARAGNDLLMNLASRANASQHPLFVRRHFKKRLIILIASDKGLAGAFNSNVFKRYLELHRTDDDRGITSVTLSVGRKASQFVTRLKDVEVIGSYDELTDNPSGIAFRTILNVATDMYIKQEIDVVSVVYTDFVSSITQTAELMRLLPAGTTVASNPEEVEMSAKEIKYEPDTTVVLDAVATRMVGARLFQALLDSRASEHSMRMLAMKNATDNASDLIEDLTLAMNKARQGAITQELSEISGGVEAIG